MKKFKIIFALLLVGILAIASLGCGVGHSLRIWDGWFTDDITSQDVDFKGALEILDVDVDPPIGGGSIQWQIANGNFRITGPTETKDVRIQARSKYRKGDLATANMYYYYWYDTQDNINQLYSPDCKVNGRSGYSLLIEWSYGGTTMDPYARINVGVWDGEITGPPVHLWTREVEDRRVEPLFDLDNWRYKLE